MRIAGVLLASALLVVGNAGAHDLPFDPALDFIPPAPGTYQLPTIMPAPDGEVLDASGRPQNLSRFTRGKITLLDLIYTRCSDPDGCPRATWAFADIKRRLQAERGLADNVRLVSLSFDPGHDTPALLKTYAARAMNGDKKFAWHFFTTASPRSLMPLLEGFGQDLRVPVEPTADGAGPVFTHTLKVFLIDRQGLVREIYSTAFLLPRMVVNDIKTLLLERQPSVAGKHDAVSSRQDPGLRVLND